MKRQRIRKISGWAYLWRLVALCAAIFFICSAKYADSGMFAFLVEWFFKGIGIFLFVLLGIFAKLGTVLETDGTFLYVVDVYYLNKFTFRTIKIEDITKMVFVSGGVETVVIQYQNKEYCLNVRKNDKAHKYLQALANVRGINQQDKKVTERVNRSRINGKAGKIRLCLAVCLVAAVLIWLYGGDLLFGIIMLGSLF